MVYRNGSGFCARASSEKSRHSSGTPLSTWTPRLFGAVSGHALETSGARRERLRPLDVSPRAAVSPEPA
jgi:hypothetical protein